MSETAEGQVMLNPAGQPVSDVVAETMATYGIEHGEVAFVAGGTWVHAGHTSAAVMVETTERATAQLVVTGPDGAEVMAVHSDPEQPDGAQPDGAQSDCAQPDGERPGLHYLHLFHLTGLEPGTRYEVRVTATGRDGQAAEGAPMPVRTESAEGAVRLSGGARSEPLLLDQTGARYVLTGDVVADGTALRVAASGVTVDLDGHEVVYNEGPAAAEGEDLAGPGDGRDQDGEEPYSIGVGTDADGWRRGAYGIEVAPDLEGVRILNGRIRQGAGANAGADSTVGFNPILAQRSKGLEIAGIAATYGGTQLSGLVCWESSEGAHVHHCRLADEGRLIRNRHRMCCALRLGSVGDGQVHHVLVARTRQSALGNTGLGAHVHHNELHIDSHSINSFGIAVKDNSRVHGNRIFGCGDNAVGLATTGGCRDIDLYDNYIWLQAHDIAGYLRHLSTKEMESAPYSIMSGVRITWGANEVTYRDNTILVTAREGGLVRGTFLTNCPKVHGCAFRDNLVIALAEDERTHCWGAVAGVGIETRGEVEPLLFEGNTIASNFACFNMQDTYGVGTNYHFVRNRFVRIGTRPGFATIRARQIRPSKGHVFLDNEWVDGADLDHLLLGPEDEFEVRETRELEVMPGAQVDVADSEGRPVWSGRADEAGRVRVALTRFRQKGEERVLAGPYRAVARRGEEERVLQVDC